MRVLIVADNALVAEGIRREMRHASGCRVAGYVNGRRPCRDAAMSELPDVVLVDDMRDRELTLERIVELRRVLPVAKLVLLTLETDHGWLARAWAAGVDAAIAKTAQPGSLGTLVRAIVRGHVFHAFAPVEVTSHAAAPSLTGRELEILQLAAAGLSNNGIARRLWVTEQTIKFHLSNVYRKLGVANRTEASHFAHVNGLLKPSPAESPPIERAA